jgi:hypothetical protein
VNTWKSSIPKASIVGTVDKLEPQGQSPMEMDPIIYERETAVRFLLLVNKMVLAVAD